MRRKNSLERMIQRGEGSGHITCRDGATLSVQAGRNKASRPREDNAGPYSHVEVGYPNPRPEGDWWAYAESLGNGNGGRPTGIYGYVPVELVRAYVAEHGGER